MFQHIFQTNQSKRPTNRVAPSYLFGPSSRPRSNFDTFGGSGKSVPLWCLVVSLELSPSLPLRKKKHEEDCLIQQLSLRLPGPLHLARIHWMSTSSSPWCQSHHALHRQSPRSCWKSRRQIINQSWWFASPPMRTLHLEAPTNPSSVYKKLSFQWNLITNQPKKLQLLKDNICSLNVYKPVVLHFFNHKTTVLYDRT